MKLLLLLGLVLSSFASLAKVEMKSIYFDTYASEATGLSKGKLLTLRNLIEQHDFQIIEINSFSSIEGGLDKNKDLSNKRIEFVLEILKVDRGAITINTFGSKRVNVNFKPQSWNRIDVYYNVETSISIPNEGQVKLVERVDVIEPSTLKITSTENDSKPLEIPALNEIVEDRPIVLPILFEEGTNDILSKDQAYLDHLYKTLKKHSTLKAEIRGHVCCENNMKASKNRAKVVYKYLVKKGIDKNRLTFKGFSNSQPISYPEKNDADRMRNRRVDIVFSK
ncbi:MAG: outer membrane protein OmpA-like peptidoglycan-associated protein [Crocinitomicaceae bacterium]|jgi:outer membrane protein OmpA-like peptidoglycan-associated protein